MPSFLLLSVTQSTGFTKAFPKLLIRSIEKRLQTCCVIFISPFGEGNKLQTKYCFQLKTVVIFMMQFWAQFLEMLHTSSPHPALYCSPASTLQPLADNQFYMLFVGIDVFL